MGWRVKLLSVFLINSVYVSVKPDKIASFLNLCNFWARYILNLLHVCYWQILKIINLLNHRWLNFGLDKKQKTATAVWPKMATTEIPIYIMNCPWLSGVIMMPGLGFPDFVFGWSDVLWSVCVWSTMAQLIYPSDRSEIH